MNDERCKNCKYSYAIYDQHPGGHLDYAKFNRYECMLNLPMDGKCEKYKRKWYAIWAK